MQVTNLRQSVSIGRASACADVRWEDTDRPPCSLFVETDQRFERWLWPDPNAFFLCAVLPAWHCHERRIWVDGGLCPILKHEIRAALRVLGAWYPEMGSPPVLESGTERLRTAVSSGALSLLSCGVDSLATLRQNKLLVPPDHPMAITAVLPVIEHSAPGQPCGAECGRLAPASRIAQDCGIDLIPVWTNAWSLVSDGFLSDQKTHGALFSGIATCFSSSFHLAYLAASFDGGHLTKPWGSSPLLDPFYSSAHFRVHHHGAGMSRFEKTALIAEWPVGLQNLRVCQRDDSATSNCGECEKCTRSMTALEALGKLSSLTDTFPSHSVTPDMLERLIQYDMITHEHQLTWYREAVEALSNRGRTDLVRTISKVCQHFDGRLAD